METFRVRGDQVDQQNGADEMASGKNRDLETASFRGPPNQQALKVALLRLVNAKMDLRNRPGKDERHGRCETNKRQL